MKIQELEAKEFGELIADKAKINKLLDDGGFNYDEMSEPDEHGFREKLVRANEKLTVPLEDILALEYDEFARKYPDPEAQNCQRNYLRKYIILSGEEALFYYKNKINEEKKRLEALSQIDKDDLSCGGF